MNIPPSLATEHKGLNGDQRGEITVRPNIILGFQITRTCYEQEDGCVVGPPEPGAGGETPRLGVVQPRDAVLHQEGAGECQAGPRTRLRGGGQCQP